MPGLFDDVLRQPRLVRSRRKDPYRRLPVPLLHRAPVRHGSSLDAAMQVVRPRDQPGQPRDVTRWVVEAVMVQDVMQCRESRERLRKTGEAPDFGARLRAAEVLLPYKRCPACGGKGT